MRSSACTTAPACRSASSRSAGRDDGGRRVLRHRHHRPRRAWRAAGIQHRSGGGRVPYRRRAADDRRAQCAPIDTAVLSVTRILAGEAYNVIPQTATHVRHGADCNRETMAMLEAGMRRIANGVAEGFGATAEVDFRYLPAAGQPCGANSGDCRRRGGNRRRGNVNRAQPPAMASEDFSFMLERCPAPISISAMATARRVHNHQYDFNDEAIPFGSALYSPGWSNGNCNVVRRVRRWQVGAGKVGAGQ